MPVISSPLTVSSPSKPPLVSLKRNTSPATVPSLGPSENRPDCPAEPPPSRRNPLTVDPCCSNSNRKSAPDPPTVCPSHVPVTSTVTSVRSIQSCCAQPGATATTATTSSPTMNFM